MCHNVYFTDIGHVQTQAEMRHSFMTLTKNNPTLSSDYLQLWQIC
jgi:hypothetical protein